MYKPDLYYFLVVSEELNITKAAKKLYLSQQSLSTYVQRLERYYGVKLFQRKPALQFTYAGEYLYRAAKQIQDVNDKILQTFNEIRSGQRGRVTLGISRPRGSVIIPDLLPRFKASFPDVDLIIVEETNAKLIEMAVLGMTDMFIGFEPVMNPALICFPLLDDMLYLMISDQMLNYHFKEIYPQCIEEFGEGVDLVQFIHLPFILNGQGSMVRMRIDDYFSQINASINIVFESASSDVTTELCMKNVGVGICSQMRLKRTMLKIAQNPESGHKIHIFPIKTQTMKTTLVLAYQKNKQLTPYHERLIQDIHSVFEQYKQ